MRDVLKDDMQVGGELFAMETLGRAISRLDGTCVFGSVGRGVEG